MGDPVPPFLEAARSFRSALASDEDVATEELARRLRNAVARVYLAATRLPRSGTRTAEYFPPPDRERLRALAERLEARLGQPSLAQELVEIDEGLAGSIVRLEDAWCAFENRWGSHAVEVLRPLHRIARGGVG